MNSVLSGPRRFVPPKVSRIIPVVSGKGGVGKSSVALGLASALAAPGRRIALVDFDPQGGVTLAAGIVRPERPLNAALARVHGISLYPSGRALATASVQQLRERLHAAAQEHEIVLIDLSPALTDAGHVAALQEASLVLVIARTDAAGLVSVAESVQMCVEGARSFLVVPSLKGRTRLACSTETLLRETYAPHVSAVSIPLDARAAEAAYEGRPVTLSATRSRASVAIRSLSEELLCLTEVSE